MAATLQKCACPRCNCQVDKQDSHTVQIQGNYYCSKQCAEGHPNGQGCGCSNTGCPCA